jgi:hypothetical protein
MREPAVKLLEPGSAVRDARPPHTLLQHGSRPAERLRTEEDRRAPASQNVGNDVLSALIERGERLRHDLMLTSVRPPDPLLPASLQDPSFQDPLLDLDYEEGECACAALVMHPYSHDRALQLILRSF